MHLKGRHDPKPNPFRGPVRDISSPQRKCVDRGGGTCAAGNGGGNSAGGGGGSTPGDGGGNSGGHESSAGTGSSSGSSTAGSTGSGGRRDDDEEDDGNQRRRCEETKAHSKEEKDEKNDDENKQDEESNPWHSDRKTGPQSNATDLNSDHVSVPEKVASVGPEKRQSDHVQRAKGSEGISTDIHTCTYMHCGIAVVEMPAPTLAPPSLLPLLSGITSHPDTRTCAHAHTHTPCVNVGRWYCTQVHVGRAKACW